MWNLLKNETHYVLCLITFFVAGTWGLLFFKEPKTEIIPFPVAKNEFIGQYFGKTPLTIDEVKKADPRKLFQPFDNRERPEKGYDAFQCWIRLPLENVTDQVQNYVIELQSSAIDIANMYVLEANGEFSIYHNGESTPLAKKEIASHIHAFPITLVAGERTILYLFLKDLFQLDPSLRLWKSGKDFEAYRLMQEDFIHLYFGLLVGLFLTNFCVFLAFRERDMLYYLTYLIAYGVLQAINFNLHFKYFFDLFTYLQLYIPSSINAFLFRGMFVMTASLLILFANIFLRTNTFSSKLHKTLRSFMTLFLLLSPLVMFGPLIVFEKAVVFIAIFAWAFGYLLTFVAGIWAAIKGVRQARFFIPALVLTIVVVWRFNWATITGQTMTASILLQWLYASGLEMTIFTFGLVDKFLYLSRQRYEAQEHAYREAHRFAELQKRYNLELSKTVEERTQQLLQANEQKARLLRIIGHDFKVPLNSLFHLSEIMLSTPEKLSRQDFTDYAQEIREIAQNQSDTMDNLLQWAAYQTREAHFRPRSYLIKEIVDSVESNLRQQAKMKEVELRFTIAEDVFVYCDFIGITTVLRNTIGNAIKFTPKAGVVEVSTKNREERLQIRIEDSGRGISAEQQALLQKGKIIGSTKGTNDEMGSGLGLRLCHDILKQHQSDLHIQSELGKGTCVTFWLPIASSSEKG